MLLYFVVAAVVVVSAASAANAAANDRNLVLTLDSCIASLWLRSLQQWREDSPGIQSAYIRRGSHILKKILHLHTLVYKTF